MNRAPAAIPQDMRIAFAEDLLEAFLKRNGFHPALDAIAVRRASDKQRVEGPKTIRGEYGKQLPPRD